MRMKINTLAGIVFTICAALGGGLVNAEDASTFPPAIGGQTVNVPASALKFAHTGLKNSAGAEVLGVDAFGNQKTGKHGTFMKYPGQFESPAHSHTYDHYAVVIKGVMANYAPGTAPVKMGPGSYWYQRGREAHITACVSKEQCLIFVVQSQTFDAQVPPETN